MRISIDAFASNYPRENRDTKLRAEFLGPRVPHRPLGKKTFPHFLAQLGAVIAAPSFNKSLDSIPTGE